MPEVTTVKPMEVEKPKEEIFYMMNMPKWFIDADEDKRIKVVEALLGTDAPKPDEEYNKKELDRLFGKLWFLDSTLKYTNFYVGIT